MTTLKGKNTRKSKNLKKNYGSKWKNKHIIVGSLHLKYVKKKVCI